MTDIEYLAAEHALGLLDGEELLRARGLVASDPAFAALAAEWQARLAPLLDRIASVEPGPMVWSGIEAAIAGGSPSRGDVVMLRRQVRRWRAATGLAAAAALVLALVSGPLAPPAPTPAATAARTLTAAIELPAIGPRLGLTYLPDRRLLLVAAQGIARDPAHVHELWVIPADGTPRPLGLVVADRGRSIVIDAQTAALLAEGATIAVSAEQPGGSTTRLPQGPVVATGKFETI